MGLQLRFPSERRYYAKEAPPSAWTLPDGPTVGVGLSYLDTRELTPESRPGNPLWTGKLSRDMADGWPTAMPPLLALKQKDRWLVIDGHHRHAAAGDAGQTSPVLWLDDTDGRVSRYINDNNTLPLRLEADLVNFLRTSGWSPACMKNWPKTLEGEKPSRESLSSRSLLDRVGAFAQRFTSNQKSVR